MVQTLSRSNKDHEEQRQNPDFQLTEANSFWLLNSQHSEDLWLDTPTHSWSYIVK